jgi:hypothetical protein
MQTSLNHAPDDERTKLGAIAALFREKVPLDLLFCSAATDPAAPGPRVAHADDAP